MRFTSSRVAAAFAATFGILVNSNSSAARPEPLADESRVIRENKS